MLKHVHCYQENGNWYMSLKYEFEDENGKHRITIPKMDFPKELTKDPKTSLIFKVNEVLNMHQASIMDPLTDGLIVDDFLEIISRRGGTINGQNDSETMD